MKYKIYALQDGLDIVYVGITKTSLEYRWKSGWKHTKQNKYLKRNCTMYVLEETDDRTREFFYIQIFTELGHPLINIVGKTKPKPRNYMDERQYMKSYYETNKERCRELMKNYQETHKEEQRKYRKEYYRKYWAKKRNKENENDARDNASILSNV